MKPAAKKKPSRLVGDGPSVPPGGLMVPPESKDAGKPPPEDFSLTSAIAALSPWAVVRARFACCARSTARRGVWGGGPQSGLLRWLGGSGRDEGERGGWNGRGESSGRRARPRLTRARLRPPAADAQRRGAAGRGVERGQAGGCARLFPAANKQHGPRGAADARRRGGRQGGGRGDQVGAADVRRPGGAAARAPRRRASR